MVKIKYWDQLKPLAQSSTHISIGSQIAGSFPMVARVNRNCNISPRSICLKQAKQKIQQSWSSL